jgi:hypothetical protein
MDIGGAAYDHGEAPVLARVRGLAVNPAISPEAIVRVLDLGAEAEAAVECREHWPDDVLVAVATHPVRRVRCLLFNAPHVSLAQLETLRRDPFLRAYAESALEERQRTVEPAPVAAPLSRADAEALTRGDDAAREAAAADPRLPADLVAVLATDPSHFVRLAVSLRPELTEEQRAAIDCRSAPKDYLHKVAWARRTDDPDVLRQCVYSAHLGLRRSVACNPHLPDDLVTVLAADEDFAVRLMLCENQTEVPGDLVVDTYLKAQFFTREKLLKHPSLVNAGLARHADSPNPDARALVHLDPDAPSALVEQLSHDTDRRVRSSMARDGRLSIARLRELFEHPDTAEAAARNPRLPGDLIERTLADAAALRT